MPRIPTLSSPPASPPQTDGAAPINDPPRHQPDPPAHDTLAPHAPDRIPPSRLRPTAIPGLLPDWKSSVLEAAVRQAGLQEIAPDIERALRAEHHRLGRDLEKPEVRRIRHQVVEQKLQAAMDQHRPRLIGDATLNEKTYDDVLARYRSVVARKKDPFMPVALGDAPARARETILWENPQVMVLVDSFSGGPKALVVPKTPTLFPCDASDALLKNCAEIAARVGDALIQEGRGTQEASIWINPPQYLSIKQMHVHVQPKLESWKSLGLQEDALKQHQQLFYARVATALTQRLGPSTP